MSNFIFSTYLVKAFTYENTFNQRFLSLITKYEATKQNKTKFYVSQFRTFDSMILSKPGGDNAAVRLKKNSSHAKK